MLTDEIATVLARDLKEDPYHRVTLAHSLVKLFTAIDRRFDVDRFMMMAHATYEHVPDADQYQD